MSRHPISHNSGCLEAGFSYRFGREEEQHPVHLATMGILEAVATASDSTVINLGHTTD